MPLHQYPNRARSLGPALAAQRARMMRQQDPRGNPGIPTLPVNNRRTPTSPFANYTGRSVGSPVGMFNRVRGFGRQFRG